MRLLLIVIVSIVAALYTLKYEFVAALFLQLLYFAGSSSWWGGEWFQPVEIFTILAVVMLLIRRQRIAVGAVGWLLLALVAVYFCSAGSAVASSSMAYRYATNLLKLWLTFLIFYNMSLHTEKFPKYFLLVNVLSLAYLAKSIIYTYLATGGNRVDVGLAQGGGANFIAILYGMTLPYVLFGVHWGRTLKSRLLYLGLAIVFVLCVVFTGSRAGFLALIFIALLVTFLLPLKSRIAFIFVAMVVAMIALVSLPDYYMSRMETISSYSDDASASDRIIEWNAALDIFAENVLSGIGGNNFYLVSHQYTGLFSREIFEGKPVGLVVHNTYLQMMAEGGVFTILFYTLALALTLSKLLKYARASSGDEERYQALSLFSGIMVFSICAVFGSQLHRDILYWYLGVSQGLTHRLSRLPEAEGSDADCAAPCVPVNAGSSL